MNPLVTIITVSYNSFNDIEETILSVINQTFKNIEYIIIDGGSTDGTIDNIKKYTESIDYFVSEKDSGVYDAMNKGIKKASGKWILFLNCGDTFYSNTILEELSPVLIQCEAGVIYGDSVFCFSHLEKKRINAQGIKNILSGMPFCHQSSFVKREIAIKNLFDTNFHYLRRL